jgi:predicted RNA-binding Zn ribbon-like protein
MNRAVTKRRPSRFELTGGMLCLDFVNTLDNRPSGQPKELLVNYVDLARFAEDTGILEAYQVDQLIERSPLAPAAAEQALRAAREMREALHEVLAATMKRQAAPRMALARINGYIQTAAEHSELIESKENKGRFEWRFTNDSSFQFPLWPIARSAAELLASPDLEFVRTCASETCQWFFLDTSKNHRRRWCDMKLCGNRAKVREFYARKRTEG